MRIFIVAFLGVTAFSIIAWTGPVNSAQNSNGTGINLPEEPGAKLLEDAVINPKSTALVFFRAGWCYPCRKMASNLVAVTNPPIIEIDVNANPNLASSYHVKDLPAMVLFSNGVAVDQKIGVVPENEISAWAKKAGGG